LLLCVTRDRHFRLATAGLTHFLLHRTIAIMGMGLRQVKLFFVQRTNQPFVIEGTISKAQKISGL
jgi:hypothetical protein